MPDNVSPAALARYLSEECDAAESEEIERWIAADPAHRALVDSMLLIWRRHAAAATDFDPDDAIWRRIAGRVGAEPPRPTFVHHRTPNAPAHQVRPSKPHSRWHNGSILAAVVLAFVSASAVWLVKASSAPSAKTDTAMREIVTHRGQQAVLDLADGSRVRIGPESRLRIPATLSDAAGTRDVTLEGAGYFTVKHDSARPFRVITSTGIVEDLGTEFVVTDYPEIHGMRVVVASGMVALRRNNASLMTPPLVTLTKGMLARLDSAGTATVMQGVDVRTYLAWTHGALAFNDTRLRNVIPELSRWYDIDITLADSTLSDRRVTASFEDESSAHALKRLALALNLRVERHGRVVKLWPS